MRQQFETRTAFGVDEVDEVNNFFGSGGEVMSGKDEMNVIKLYRARKQNSGKLS